MKTFRQYIAETWWDKAKSGMAAAGDYLRQGAKGTLDYYSGNSPSNSLNLKSIYKTLNTLVSSGQRLLRHQSQRDLHTLTTILIKLEQIGVRPADGYQDKFLTIDNGYALSRVVSYLSNCINLLQGDLNRFVKDQKVAPVLQEIIQQLQTVRQTWQTKVDMFKRNNPE